MKTFVLVALVALVSCGDGVRSDSPTDVSTSTSACLTAGPTPSVDGPVMRYLVPSCNTDGMAALIRGKLELRGACLYIVSGEGRYPVLWPYGTQWDKVNNTVVARDGTIIPLGREVAGAGGFLHVGDVQRLADDRAAALASQCAVGGTGEIAVLNNDDNDFVTTLG